MGYPKGTFEGGDEITAAELLQQPSKFGYLVFNNLRRRGNTLYVESEADVVLHASDDEVIRIQGSAGTFVLEFLGFSDGYRYMLPSPGKTDIPVKSFKFAGKAYAQWDDSKFSYTCVAEMQVGGTGFIQRQHVVPGRKGYEIHAGSGISAKNSKDHYPVKRTGRKSWEFQNTEGEWVALTISK